MTRKRSPRNPAAPPTPAAAAPPRGADSDSESGASAPPRDVGERGGGNGGGGAVPEEDKRALEVFVGAALNPGEVLQRELRANGAHLSTAFGSLLFTR